MKSYSKINRQKIQAHILERYDEEMGGVQGLRENVQAARHPRDSEEEAAIRLVEGGDFLISYYDQRQFIDSLELNDTKKDYSDGEVWHKYKHLLAREINNLIKAEA